MSQQPDSDVDEAVTSSSDVADVTVQRYRHPFLVYTALRLGLLLVVAAVCYLLGARGILLILLAFGISAIASWVLLAKPREEVGRRTGAYFGRLNQRIEDSKTAEDHLFEGEDAKGDAEATDAADVTDTKDAADVTDTKDAADVKDVAEPGRPQ